MTITQIKKVIVPILQAHGIRRAAVFGSVARGEETSESDVDLLIELPRPIGLLPFAGLNLVEYDALRRRLKSQVLADQAPIL
jgi:predicted nucleotidyltransferase